MKYRPRYKQPEFKVDRGCRIGRSYADFQKFLGNNPETTIVQMDSVIGRVGGKCLLTIHFVETSLMLAHSISAGCKYICFCDISYRSTG